MKKAQWAILSVVTGGFMLGLYGARHSLIDLAFVVGDYGITYYGLWLLYTCLEKHELLRGDDGPAGRDRAATGRAHPVDALVPSGHLDGVARRSRRRDAEPGAELWPVGARRPRHGPQALLLGCRPPQRCPYGDEGLTWKIVTTSFIYSGDYVICCFCALFSICFWQSVLSLCVTVFTPESVTNCRVFLVKLH